MMIFESDLNTPFATKLAHNAKSYPNKRLVSLINKTNNLLVKTILTREARAREKTFAITLLP